MLAAKVRVIGGMSVEDGAMASWIASQRFDTWIHHHHPMENFRAPGYDMELGRQVAIEPLDELFRALFVAGVRVVLHSGTYFEPGEGGRNIEAPSTPYAQLKGTLSKAVLTRATDAGMAFGKIVISAPTGALENDDRLTPQLILSAEQKKTYTLRSPDSIMDMIPGEALAQIYVETALERMDANYSNPMIRRPSGWVVTAGEWVQTVQAKLLPKIDGCGPLALSVPEEAHRAPPVVFQNPASERVAIDWDDCWSRYAQDWRNSQPFR
jgi:hypothetical protein